MCLNTGVVQLRSPIIPEQCRLGHAWRPGTAQMSWEACDCYPAQDARGGHVVVRCLADYGGGRCPEEWMAPRHTGDHLKGPLGHHRPGYR